MCRGYSSGLRVSPLLFAPARAGAPLPAPPSGAQGLRRSHGRLQLFRMRGGDREGAWPRLGLRSRKIAASEAGEPVRLVAVGLECLNIRQAFCVYHYLKVFFSSMCVFMFGSPRVFL